MMGQNDVTLCPWDGDSAEEEDEEWLFSSIREYSHLYMYSTNMRPVTATMALGPDTRSLALGDKERGHLEVFRLPGKLMAATEEEEGLTSNRDFALVSGSVDCDKVTGVSYIKQDMIATTNTDSASVSLWTWKAGDDLLHSSGDLCTCDFHPEGLSVKSGTVTLWGGGRVGIVSTGVRMVDTRAVVSEGETVSGVTTSDTGHVTWVADTGGHLTTVDWRTAGAGTRVKLGEGETRDVRSAVSVEGDRVRLVTNTGAELSVWDLRDTKTATCHVMTPPGVTRDSPMTLGRDKLILGAGPRVRLLSLSDLSSKFEHRGHRSEVTGVMCHQDSDIVISCDANQGLHAWVPVL